MKRAVMRTALPLMTTAAVLLTTASAGAVTPDDEPVPADDVKIILNDGTVVDANGGFEFTFTGDKPTPKTTRACPEINDPPTYTVKGTPYFLPDRRRPLS